MKQLKSARGILAIVPLIFIIMILSSGGLLYGEGKFQLLENPTPTFVETEKDGKTLDYCGTLPDPQEGGKIFFTRPVSFTADPEGNFYIYDAKQIKILKYNKDLQYIHSIGNRGEGPGDFKIDTYSSRVILRFVGNYLYAYNTMGKKVMLFDRDLKYIQEFRLKERDIDNIFAADECGNFYFRHCTSGIWVYDQTMNLKGKMLSDMSLIQFPYELPHEGEIKNPFNYVFLLLDLDVTADNTLIAHSKMTGQLFFMKDLKLIKTLCLYSQPLLDNHRKNLKELAKSVERTRINLKKKGIPDSGFSSISMYVSFFLDRDDERFFFLQYFHRPRREVLLYRFNLQGNFNCYYSIPLAGDDDDPGLFHIKKNRTFLTSTMSGKVLIYKEK